MNGLKVLVVDDEPLVREIIRLYLETQQVEVIEASDGNEALELAGRASPNLIVLDVMMPGLDGYETCRELLKLYDIPVIMLSGKCSEFDRVLGLELGADDYVTKPFSPRELMARIKAVFRRKQGRKAGDMDDTAPVMEFDGLTIHLDRREVLVNEEKVTFRPKEFELLAQLAKSPGLVYTREQLLEQVWGYDFTGDIRTVDVHVKRTRSKLSDFGCDCIHTVWGVGYKFEVV